MSSSPYFGMLLSASSAEYQPYDTATRRRSQRIPVPISFQMKPPPSVRGRRSLLFTGVRRKGYFPLGLVSAGLAVVSAWASLS